MSRGRRVAPSRTSAPAGRRTGSRRASADRLVGSARERWNSVRDRSEIRRRARRASSHRPPVARAGTTLTLGIPVPLIILTLALAAATGILLTYALSQTTQGNDAVGPAGLQGGTGGGKNPAAPVVVTESTLGPEVQRLVDTGTLQSAADFDVPACLSEQGIHDKVMIMEEIQWGSGTQRAWLLVHTPSDPTQVRSAGGTVNATVVLPTCGTHGGHAAASRLWSGSTVLSPSTV